MNLTKQCGESGAFALSGLFALAFLAPNSGRTDEVVTSVMSPVASYLYLDSADNPTTISSVVSFIYPDTLNDSAMMSRVVSYQYRGLEITRQPLSRFAGAGTLASFSVQVGGSSPLNFQWRKNGVNIAGATTPILNLNSVNTADDGGYSVAVRNDYGSAVSEVASLAVLAEGANGTSPTQMQADSAATQQPTQDSLIVITHGWEILAGHADWIDDMAGAIDIQLSSQNKLNWKVDPIHWEHLAALSPDLARVGAEIAGSLYGATYAQFQWQHVHLIAHSAGAVFIEAFATEIKRAWPNTEVHCTFLDPYLSIVWGWSRENYGKHANWSDCYFSHDITGVLTGGNLVHAHNVDVTDLDTQQDQLFEILHNWPHEFYYDTVNGSLDGTAGYGFPLSKEGGGWDSIGNYQPNGDKPVFLPLGPQDIPSQPDLRIYGVKLALGEVPSAASASGATLLDNGSLALAVGTTSALLKNGKEEELKPLGEPVPTRGPAWLAFGVTITSIVNYVEFEAGFTSTNAAEGALTVYWNTNQIGLIDERVETAGSQHHRFALPSAVSNGLYTLSFRLDAFNNTASSILITNVVTGFVGITQPITLTASLSGTTNSTAALELTGAPGFNYIIESSTNLTHWAPVGVLLNTNGTVRFLDSSTVTNLTPRFYRASLPF